jgi:hypothetical protein
MRGALLAAACALTAPCWAQPSAEDMNASNNPLHPAIGLNLQDAYTGRFYGRGDQDANALLLRGTVPHKLFGQAQILRATLPITTTPDVAPAGRRTGAGDLNLFDLFLFKLEQVEFGIGPQLTIPTASRDETGTGKWQAGLAAALIAPQRWGMLGGLLTWQHSFAGDDDRPTQNNLQLQPLVIRNFPQGWYFRSTAAWNFDLKRDTYSIPVGLGFGKVWKAGKTTMNLFAEPQWTVAHAGDGQPKFQLFFGLNMQFPL